MTLLEVRRPYADRRGRCWEELGLLLFSVLDIFPFREIHSWHSVSCAAVPERKMEIEIF